MALHVVCVRQGDKYSTEYTRMLHRMVETYLDSDLIILGDGEDADVQLQHGFTGWNAKLELFSPEFAYRPCFFLDLDTYILADCRDYLVEPEELLLIRDFYAPQRGNSGLMMIPEDTDLIWRNCPSSPRTDGGYLNTQQHQYMQDRFSGIKSYKADKLQDDPGDTRICCFHGKPKPHDTQGWAQDIWRIWTS